ncbi:MAG: hypothetical protein ACJAT7_001738 [Psychromonas sp.]|uniref:hypothetical protein n=1 Tax=Psychromonas sp. TaxID=1884585 RepID=UPI0039E2F780
MHKKDGELIACGFAHISKRLQGKSLYTTIIERLDSELLSNGVQNSFLFTYEPKIYHSSGYSELVVPIHYYDNAKGNGIRLFIVVVCGGHQ